MNFLTALGLGLLVLLAVRLSHLTLDVGTYQVGIDAYMQERQ